MQWHSLMEAVLRCQVSLLQFLVGALNSSQVSGKYHANMISFRLFSATLGSKLRSTNSTMATLRLPDRSALQAIFARRAMHAELQAYSSKPSAENFLAAWILLSGPFCKLRGMVIWRCLNGCWGSCDEWEREGWLDDGEVDYWGGCLRGCFTVQWGDFNSSPWGFYHPGPGKKRL